MSQSHNHKHSYEDILIAVGEFGPWQFKRLLSLWLIMLMAGAQYNLMQFFNIKHDEFLCEPPETANCTLNITLDGRVIAKGSNWRFAENTSISLDDKVNKYSYHHVFPGFYPLHHEHPNNEGYGNGFRSKDIFLTKIQEAHMSNTFCRVNNPFKDENGNCFWNESSILQDGNMCRNLQIDVALADQNWNFYYRFNKDVSMSSEFYFGLICLNHLERSLLNAVLTVGMIVICFIYYILAEKFGRRIALTITMLVLIFSKFGQIIIKEAWYPHQHYSIFYIRRILMTSGKMSIVQVCYTYLAEIGGFRKKVFSFGPFHFTYNSLIATSFAIPFYLGEFVGGYQWFNIYAVWVAADKGQVDLSESEKDLYWIALSWVPRTFYVIPLVTLLLLPESPWWLLRYGYYGRAKEVLTEVAKDNKEEVDIEIYPVAVTNKYEFDEAEILKRIFVTFKNPDKDNVDLETRYYSLKQTFCCPELATITLSFALSWFMKGLTIVLVVYHDDTTQENSEFYNRRMSEVLGIILLMFFENIFGRRGCLLSLQVCTAIELLYASVYTHQATSLEYNKESRKRIEENCLIWLAMSHSARTSLLFWYCLSIYPISLR